MKPKFTPEKITSLEPNEIFVFGSNMRGSHIGGAARIAFEKFGAEFGFAEGFTGNCYAIPTLDRNMRPVTRQQLRNSLSLFIGAVLNNQDKTFYLTKIGCGIAGWDVDEIREMFWDVIKDYQPEEGAYLPSNLVIPIEFSNNYNGLLKVAQNQFELWKKNSNTKTMFNGDMYFILEEFGLKKEQTEKLDELMMQVLEFIKTNVK